MNEKQYEIKYYEYNAHFKYKELYNALLKLQIDKEYQNNNVDNLNKQLSCNQKNYQKEKTKTNLKNLNKNKSLTNKQNKNIMSRNVELDNYIKNFKIIQMNNDLDLKTYYSKTYISNNNNEDTLRKNKILKSNNGSKKCNNINIINIKILKRKKKKSPLYPERPPSKNSKNNLMINSLFSKEIFILKKIEEFCKNRSISSRIKSKSNTKPQSKSNSYENNQIIKKKLNTKTNIKFINNSYNSLKGIIIKNNQFFHRKNTIYKKKAKSTSISKKKFPSKKLDYKKRIKSNSNKHKTLKDVYSNKIKTRKPINNNSTSFFIIPKNKENVKKNIFKYNKIIYTNYQYNKPNENKLLYLIKKTPYINNFGGKIKKGKSNIGISRNENSFKKSNYSTRGNKLYGSNMTSTANNKGNYNYNFTINLNNNPRKVIKLNNNINCTLKNKSTQKKNRVE